MSQLEKKAILQADMRETEAAENYELNNSSKIRIAVLASGGGTDLQSVIDGVESGYIPGEIDVVISNKKSAYALERARAAGIDAMNFSLKKFGDIDSYNNAIVEELNARNIDLVVLAGYLKILNSKFITSYKNRIINIHPSLIPSFCGKGFYGMKVHEAAIERGVKLSGATVHFVDEGADTGPIICQRYVGVHFDDTPETLQKRILEIEHEILPLCVKKFCEHKIIIKNRKVMVLD